MDEEPIYTLPEELIFLIFDFFTKIDFVNFRITNKHFKLMVNNYLKLKNINTLKVKGIRLPIQIRKFRNKWDRFFKYEDSFYLHFSDILLDFKNKIEYRIGVDNLTCIKLYKDRIYITSYDCNIICYKSKGDSIIKEKTFGNESNGTIVNFDIKNDKIYFCGNYSSIDCWDIEANFIKSFKVKFCSSNLILNQEGTLIMVIFNRQSAVSFYNEKDNKELSNYSFKRFGKITVIENNFNMFYVGLDNGNVNVFDGRKLVYFVDTKLKNIHNILPVSNIFYAVDNIEKKIKVCSDRKVINNINLCKTFSIISFTIENGNLVLLYCHCEIPFN